MASSGKYDKRVQVQKFTTARNEFREKVKTWADDKKIWADVDYGSAGERRVGAAQEQSSALATVVVRSSSYTRQIKPEKARLAFDGLVWDIESAVPGKDRNNEIIIVAKAAHKDGV